MRRTLGAVCLAVGVVLVGCGVGADTAEVRGKVTYDGKPVPEGRIIFWPERGRPVMAELAADGVYTLRIVASQDGPIPGEYRVTIKATRARSGAQPPAPEAPPQAAAGAAQIEWLVPQIYERPEKPPLRASVQRGQNVFDFNLQPPQTLRAPAR